MSPGRSQAARRARTPIQAAFGMASQLGSTSIRSLGERALDLRSLTSTSTGSRARADQRVPARNGKMVMRPAERMPRVRLVAARVTTSA